MIYESIGTSGNCNEHHIWQVKQCAIAPLIPLTIGNGNDKVAAAPSGKIIGESAGSFQSIRGLTSETDSVLGANYFSLQVNSETFPTSTTYTAGNSTTGWEQLLYLNNPGGVGGVGYVFIQYWLLGYNSQYHDCPPIQDKPPGGSSWTSSGGSCYANSAALTIPSVTASGIVNLSLDGYANFRSSGNDEVTICDLTSCTSVILTEHVVDLYKNWQDSEFNIFGYANGSEANFNAGTSMTLWNILEDQNANTITPGVVNTGYTGETNNLSFCSCCSNGGVGGILYTEHN
jgi:hypothetical protein